jgi:hypothetical protein
MVVSVAEGFILPLAYTNSENKIAQSAVFSLWQKACPGLLTMTRGRLRGIFLVD